ncbi:hypothetical protein GCM10027610_084290 [Dactylosporangium cerinum]
MDRRVGLRLNAGGRSGVDVGSRDGAIGHDTGRQTALEAVTGADPPPPGGAAPPDRLCEPGEGRCSAPIVREWSGVPVAGLSIGEGPPDSAA